MACLVVVPLLVTMIMAGWWDTLDTSMITVVSRRAKHQQEGSKHEQA